MPKNRVAPKGSKSYAGAALQALVEFLAYYEARYGTLTRAQLERAWRELKVKREHRAPEPFAEVLEILRGSQHSQKLRTAWSQWSAERAHRTAEASRIDAVRRAHYSEASSVLTPKPSLLRHSDKDRKSARHLARLSVARKK